MERKPSSCLLPFFSAFYAAKTVQMTEKGHCQSHLHIAALD